jgi:hypothetical protein
VSAIEDTLGQRRAVPDLRFSVQEAAAMPYAVVPTLCFTLAVEALGAAVRAVVLDVQIQIAARQRGYDTAAQERLLELFGTPDRWGTTLRTLPWLRTTLTVAAFESSTRVALPVPCTYDLEVTAARYFAALTDGIVPLEFMFSGSVFFLGPAGALQTARIGLDREARYGLPVAVWRETMDRHFAGTAWLRVGQESFGRLCAYKARHAFAGWDDAIDALLDAEHEAPR